MKSIRTLKAGERIPQTPPRRYPNDSGYIRLRWKIGVGEYVECYEHRVFDGVVTDAEHVHHRNHVRDDNRPENLKPLTADEHAAEHGSPVGDEAVRLYASGLSVRRVAAIIGREESATYRLLVRRGVDIRPPSAYRKLDHLNNEVIRLNREGLRDRRIALAVGISQTTVRRILRDAGIPPNPTGAPATDPAAARAQMGTGSGRREWARTRPAAGTGAA